MPLEDRIDLGAQPRTVVVNGDGSTTLTFPVPAATIFALESVYVEVDTSGAGPTTATLTIADQSGQVIATKRQGQTIDAGASGSATWALRLADEAAAAPVGGGIQFDTFPQAGEWLFVETTGPGTTPFGFGIELKPSDGLLVNTPRAMQVFAGQGIGLTATGGNVGLIATGFGSGAAMTADQTIEVGCGVGEMRFDGTEMHLQAFSVDIAMRLAAGKQFIIYDSGGAVLASWGP